jgi:hypothetical protein
MLMTAGSFMAFSVVILSRSFFCSSVFNSPAEGGVMVVVVVVVAVMVMVMVMVRMMARPFSRGILSVANLKSVMCDV